MTATTAIWIGLEACCEAPPAILQQSRSVGLVCNQASVDRDFVHAADRLHAVLGDRLAALFGPQHGLWSTEQDNMVETAHGVHPRLGIPVHSLYSETRRPTPQMLRGLDLLVVDLQDVGTRVYTYAWTLTNCMAAATAAGLPVLVLDRPNPLGCEEVEGPMLDMAFESFVGGAPIALRHGLTLGELAHRCNDLLGLATDLHVVPCNGVARDQLWPELGREWIPPSPNLPRFAGALVYPGQVLLEGTRLSEGRGTTTPFEQFGAPFIDPFRLRDTALEHDLPGVALRPVRFESTFQKHAGEPCGGLFLHVTDPATFRPVRTTAVLLRTVRELWPDRFEWLPPPYEYEAEKAPIDILSGSPALRAFVDGELAWDELPAILAATGSATS
ncbi:MAG: DUF1343 domain-containing protein [bacterium]|nr:DUF1343 domain-containing protein [bacterium]